VLRARCPVRGRVQLDTVPVRPDSAREVARSVISDVRRRNAWAGAIIADAIASAHLDDRDGALATRLVYGVVSAQGTLDEALDRYLSRPSRVHPAVRDVLRLAAYELLFARTPARAVVHEAVESARHIQPSSAGMTNAVLRRLATDAPSFPWGDPRREPDALARATGHPLWLVELLVSEIGWDAAHAFLNASLAPAPTYLAHNPFAGSLDDLLAELQAVGGAPELCSPLGCVRADVPRAALRSPAMARGACVSVDAAAQVIASLASPPPGGVAVDCATGRGTKTLLMQADAVRCGSAARIVAADINASKVKRLQERMAFLGVPGVDARVADLTDMRAIETLGGQSSADVVLLDAPCSNLGTLRRHPERTWRITPRDIDTLARLGQLMLETASRLVRPGGFVVYSTCTVTQRENTDVIEAFLSSETGTRFVTSPVGERLPEEWRHCVTSQGWFQSLPAPGGPDGHFAAMLWCVR